MKTGHGGASFRRAAAGIMIVVLLAAVVALIDYAVGRVPSQYTVYDLSSDRLITLSEQTKGIVRNVEDELTIYWMVTAGKEDQTLGLMLDRYESLNGNLRIEKVDPASNPNFGSQYTSYTVFDNSLIVVSGDRSRFISFYSIYVYDYSNYMSAGTVDISFDGESCLTSAIYSVTSGGANRAYILGGHGEPGLPDTLTEDLERDNFTVSQLSLQTGGDIPGDCACLIIAGPSRDISSTEAERIKDYLAAGGSLMLATFDLTAAGFPNLLALMSDYGAQMRDGVVFEGDTNYYLSSAPYILVPELAEHEITQPLLEQNYLVMVPYAQALREGRFRSGLTVEPLLTTTGKSYVKSDSQNITTYEKEDGDATGPFALGLAITDSGAENEARLVWVSAYYMFTDDINNQISGANYDFFLNAISWMINQRDTISVRSKLMTQEYYIIPESRVRMLSVILIGAVPAAALLTGALVWRKRRKR